MCYISLNKYSAKSPYWPDSPTWLATMYGTNLHKFGDLTRICQNRHIRQFRQHGWPPCIELIYIHLAIWQEFAIFAEVAIFANMAGHHVWNCFTYIWQFDNNSPNSQKLPYSPDSPTWLPTMYGTDLHTFGDLTRIRHNPHICQNCKNRQIVGDILFFANFVIVCIYGLECCWCQQHCMLCSSHSSCRRGDRSGERSTNAKIESLKTKQVHSEDRIGERTDGG